MGRAGQLGLCVLDRRGHGNDRAPRLLRRAYRLHPLCHPRQIRRRVGRGHGHFRHPAGHLEPGPVGWLGVHRRTVGPLWLQADNFRRHDHQVQRLPGDGIFPQLCRVFRRRDVSRLRHFRLQAGHPGHADPQLHPPQQLGGVGGLLSDSQHRRLDRPVDRHANAPNGLEICLLHQCRLHLSEFPAAPDLQGTRQGRTARTPRPGQVRSRHREEPVARIPARTQETPPASLSC